MNLYNIYVQVCAYSLQELIISMCTRKPHGEVVIEQEIANSSEILTKLRLTEWKLHDYLIIRQTAVCDKYSQDDGERSLLSIVCKASRRPSFYILNFFVAMVQLLLFYYCRRHHCHRMLVYLFKLLSLLVLLVLCWLLAGRHN